MPDALDRLIKKLGLDSDFANRYDRGIIHGGPERPADKEFAPHKNDPGEGEHIDLPYESGSADPQPLEYGDLPDKRYEEGGDFRAAQRRGSGDGKDAT